MPHPHFRRVLSGLLVMAAMLAILPARAQLVMTNFSAAKPMKIMCVGDSITDDCVFNGAWRQFLQPILESNGYPFTFVGRLNSAVSNAFTKTAHEGYCGAVIGAPGVTTGNVHGYTPFSVCMQLFMPDALNANTPDLILVLIGANDMGHARDPYAVTFTNMSKVLSNMFVKAPNAHIILTKTTTLQNASLIVQQNGSNLLYGDYATNVPIYNADLQLLVNQRRAVGQKVFLADMFSVVDYATMFNSDHLHPNGPGLQAIAKEFFDRIQSLAVRTNQVITNFIHGGDIWRYSDTGQDLGTNWSQPNFDDHTWSNSMARFGYGDLTVATPLNFGGDTNNRYITTYFRRSFVVPDGVAITNLNVRLVGTDGAVVWLNGQEAFRTNLPAGAIAYTNRALSAISGFTNYIFRSTDVAVSNGLPSGTNIIAVEIHKNSPTNAAQGFDMELTGTGVYAVAPPPAPALSIALINGTLALSWPVTNATDYLLYSTTNLTTAGDWSSANASLQTNGSQITATLTPDATTKFFRLQKP